MKIANAVFINVNHVDFFDLHRSKVVVARAIDKHVNNVVAEITEKLNKINIDQAELNRMRFKAACAAMSGLLSNINIARDFISANSSDRFHIDFAKASIEYADALVNEFQKPSEP
jgi:hypothetical protein